ncbi:MAG: hypothetical protein JSV88_11120 [Candidatus Aminicenantes bacterium]|nr:MAG: hypothetical protein JSV88_11120 [Candidatus Aminicenantes bacterium]
MNTSKSIFYLEFKKSCGKWHVLVILVFYVILMVMAQVGMNEYKGELKEVEIANRLEKLKAGQFDRYTPYSVFGVQFIIMPTPLNFLQTFQVYNDLVSAVDSGTKLLVYESKKGNNVTPDTAAGYLNFSGLLFLFGSILACVYGYMGYNNEKYLKYLCRLKAFNNVFFSIFAVRLVLFSLTVLFILASNVGLALLNGIHILDSHYLWFSLLVLVVLNFFLFIGALFGALKNRKAGIALVVGMILILDFLVPWLVIKTVKNISVSISEHQTQYDQLIILMAFEKLGIKTFGDLRSGDEVKEFMKSYLKNQLTIQEEMESKHRQRIIEKIEKYRMISVFFPSSFYLTSTAEISGKGYNNYFAFYDFTKKKKREFIVFYFQKEYFETPEPGKVESFIKGNDSIFRCVSSLPGNFLFGMGLLLFYMVVAVIGTYFIVYNKVYPVKKKLPGEIDMFIHIEKEEDTFFFTRDPLVKAKIYNHFSGIETLESDIYLLPESSLDTTGKIDFAYLPNPRDLKGICAKMLYKFLNREKMDKNQEKWMVMLKHALQYELIILDDFFKDLGPYEINEALKILKEKDKFFLVITNDYYMTKALADKKNICYLKTDPTSAPIRDEKD